MEQQEVRFGSDGFGGHLAPQRLVLTRSRPCAVATLPAERVLTSAINSVAAVGLEDGVVVLAVVDLVANLDKNVGVALGQQPVGGGLGRTDHGMLVGQPLVLAEVEVAQDRDHTQIVSPVQDAREPRQVVVAQRALAP